MIRLSEDQIQNKISFIKKYLTATNAADGSHFDSNANVSHKNIATLEAEINKDINIQINRKLVANKIQELYGDELANEYYRQIEDHEIYVHDETSLKPYCVSVTMYPLLLDGLIKLGGESKAPQHLDSFCGTFINFVFAISSQFAGAVATVEFLTYFNYFAEKKYGANYLNSNTNEINQFLQQVVYSINQPAAARGYQSVFWNISLYDEYYFNALFANFMFPDGTKPNWTTLDQLQKHFLKWLNQEREKSLLTFPVLTLAMLTENKKIRSTEYQNLCVNELSEGNSFFIYLSDNADSLASCCRLRNEITSHDFSYSLGAGGIATGSINVITLNINKLIQENRNLKDDIIKIQKYQIAYRNIMNEFHQNKMLTAYSAGFISLDKQYLTIGLNGLVEAAEYLKIEINYNQDYMNFVDSILKPIFELNKKASLETGFKFNTEFVPAENLGVKNAKWDQQKNLKTQRDCYNSYFYKVEENFENPFEKFDLHGENFIKYLDGGSALHLNLDESLTYKQYLILLNYAAKSGCNYFCTNIKSTICNDCHSINKKTTQVCAKCGSKNIDYATRIIGYLKRITSFGSGRRKEHKLRNYSQELKIQNKTNYVSLDNSIHNQNSMSLETSI